MHNNSFGFAESTDRADRQDSVYRSYREKCSFVSMGSIPVLKPKDVAAFFGETRL